ncbi:hypothetical protein [Streptomyces sp. NPDC090994]|uniref:hypothetical protein n=1 Tax=Streptomyces sp. NPDC090994 TaxID=3365969 RepID=UPI00381DF892
MGTAERREAPGNDGAARRGGKTGLEVPDHGVPAARRGGGTGGAARGARAASVGGGPSGNGAGAIRQRPGYRPLWVEEPARRRRLPDPVRTAAVRAVIIVAVTLIQAMVAFLCTMAGSWLAFPMLLSSVASTVAATWGVLDVWVTRQVWIQRHGVISMPNSTARALRRERRRARRQARSAERAQERIRRRGRGGQQLSHP